MSAQTIDSIAGDLAGLRGERVAKGPKCSVTALLDRLGVEQPGEVAEAVRGAFDDEQITAEALSRYVESKFGTRIAPNTIRRHRRRHTSQESCRCPK